MENQAEQQKQSKSEDLEKQQQQQPQEAVNNIEQPLVNVDKKRTSLLVLGMAGSGKTTFVQKLCQKIFEHKADPGFILNLDPAVQFTPYTPQIDIRNKIDIKKLMKSHGLGPNGAIVTAMNLYCTEIDNTIADIQQSDYLSNYVVVDTPGQIEVFSWSASGSIISQALSTSMPTVLLYVLDIQRCMNPNSFMSNMMFALSIFYKMKLPMILVFNKEDTGDKQKLFTWMKDYDTFLDALQEEKTFLSTLSKSMVLNLDEFYQDLRCCAVSSKLGTGFEDLYPLIESARQEYFDITLPDLEDRVRYQDEDKVNENLKRFQEDKQKMEEEIIEKGKQAGFNPQVNVFNVGQGQQQQNQESKTKQDLKKKKQQMDLEEQQQNLNDNSSKNLNTIKEVEIEEEISNLQINKK